MKICFSGFNSPIKLDRSKACVLEVHNRALFARVSSSLISGLGDGAVEPYTLWSDEGNVVHPNSAFLPVCSPLCLPWDDKSLIGGVTAHCEELVFEDESMRSALECTFASLESCLSQVALKLNSDYMFGIDWEVKRFLRTYGFGVELDEGELLIDKVIKFLMFAKDASLKKVLLFINLKPFLTEIELNRFFEQAFFSNLPVMLIENAPDDRVFEHETKYVIDQDLLESW